MSVVIKEVTSKKELKKFVKFNIELYKGNPYHVPGLIEEEMVTLDKKKNPAFEVCTLMPDCRQHAAKPFVKHLFGEPAKELIRARVCTSRSFMQKRNVLNAPSI